MRQLRDRGSRVQVARRGLATSFLAILLFLTSILAAEPVSPPAEANGSDASAAPGGSLQDCSEGATVCGRRSFEAGTLAFEQGDFPAASRAFQSALALRPHAVIRYNLALSLARLGQPTAAIQQLSQVLRDPTADKAIRTRAEQELRSAQQALARVSFVLSDPSRERVEIDGAPVVVPERGELTFDPGVHHVRVVSGSSILLDQNLELSPSERVELRVGERSRRIDIVVVPEAKPSSVPPSSVPPRDVKPRVATRNGLAPAWFYGGLGVTVVLTGLTVWSGIDTNSAFDDYQSDLPRLSQAEADERVRSGHARERRTNWLLAGSVACGAASTALGVWFVDFGGSRRASVVVGPTGLGLRGRF